MEDKGENSYLKQLLHGGLIFLLFSLIVGAAYLRLGKYSFGKDFYQVISLLILIVLSVFIFAGTYSTQLKNKIGILIGLALCYVLIGFIWFYK